MFSVVVLVVFQARVRVHFQSISISLALSNLKSMFVNKSKDFNKNDKSDYMLMKTTELSHLHFKEIYFFGKDF